MGGYVYRGSQSITMQGYYFYGDLCSGKVFGLVKNSNNTWTHYLLASTGYNITSFGEDEQGELYLVDYGGGQILKISHHITYVKKTYTSQGSLDGYITETSSGSGLGGTINSKAAQFKLGDTTGNQQYRAVLSFNTSGLPDTAIISSATLKIRLASKSSISPFSVLGNLSADIAVPNFGSSPALEAGDFQAVPTQTGVAAFNSVPSGGWYSANISSGDLSHINLTGNTQFRLEFDTPSNNDGISNFANFNSGNAGSYHPQLIIQYYIP